MFWNRKAKLEKEKEKRLAVLQLEKLIERAIKNANDAIVAFDQSKENKYDSSKESAEVIAGKIFTLTQFMSARRFIEQRNVSTI